MEIRTIIASLAVAVAASLGAVYITYPEPTETPAPNVVGAISSPDLQSSYFSFGGVRQWAAKVDLRSGSTSLASIQSPAATTTLVYAGCVVTGGNSYANDFQLGFGIPQGATTTGLARFSAAAGGGAVGIATSTSLVQTFGNGGKDGQIPPNTWINCNVSTTTASATYAPTGSLSAVFREI